MKEERAKETLGQRLNRIRQEKGLTLEEVSKNTRIHSRVLNAIEEDRIESATNLFYARAFVKRYAHFLGAEGDELVAQFLSGAKKPTKQIFILEGEKEKEWVDILKLLKILSIIFFSAIFLLYSFSAVRSFVRKKNLARPVSKKVEKQKIENKAAAELTLTVSSKEDSWLQLKRDGKIIFKGVLAKGKKESWKAKAKFELWVGNAGGIELSLNGKELGSPGKKGEIIKNIVITKEGMKIK